MVTNQCGDDKWHELSRSSPFPDQSTSKGKIANEQLLPKCEGPILDCQAVPARDLCQRNSAFPMKLVIQRPPAVRSHVILDHNRSHE